MYSSVNKVDLVVTDNDNRALMIAYLTHAQVLPMLVELARPYFSYQSAAGG